jgi:hypothetical protein
LLCFIFKFSFCLSFLGFFADESEETGCGVDIAKHFTAPAGHENGNNENRREQLHLFSRAGW